LLRELNPGYGQPTGVGLSVPLTKTAVDHILTTPELSDAERAAILGATAEKLLAIKPA
jgi:aminocarboxymuconate-semialdehyde decarboxylase